MVRLVLVRHGQREREGGELAPLTSGGRWQAETLAQWLENVPQYRPQAILCSHSRHAQEHARIVSGLLPKGVPVVPVTALTPHTPEADFHLAGMRHESAKTIDWKRTHTVSCIGHEPRLQKLVAAMTGESPETLAFCELLCMEGDSWAALECGCGRVVLRMQPATISSDNTDLLPKIGSKIQTSTLLAGFSSTVFGVVLTQSDYWTVWGTVATWPSGLQAWKAAAITAGLVCLALATLLFVVSIYMYDRLALPERYWESVDSGRTPPQERWRSFRRDRVRHGLLYAYMIWTWRFVFTAAVVMAMLGFLALVLHRGVWPVTGLILFAIAAAIVYYRLFRPELGVD